MPEKTINVNMKEMFTVKNTNGEYLHYKITDEGLNPYFQKKPNNEMVIVHQNKIAEFNKEIRKLLPNLIGNLLFEKVVLSS